MNRSFSLIAAGAALSVSAGAAAAGEVRTSGEKDCEVVRIARDGSETRSRADAASARGSANAASASASARSSSSSRSSVSVSSSSGSGDGSRHVATSSATDAEGRTVTTRHDENGCTITIDERGVQGE